MLDDFVQQKLASYAAMRHDIMRKLDDLSREEEEQQRELAQITEQEDLGVELFSPRKIYLETDHRISRLKQHIEDLRFQEAKLREELEQIIENEEKYRELNEEMLHKRLEREVDLLHKKQEIRKEQDREAESQDKIRILQEEIIRIKQDRRLELEDLKTRIEKCYQASHVDRIKCKDELKRLLRYMDQIVSRET